jgi:hypothetical protein
MHRGNSNFLKKISFLYMHKIMEPSACRAIRLKLGSRPLAMNNARIALVYLCFDGILTYFIDSFTFRKTFSGKNTEIL